MTLREPRKRRDLQTEKMPVNRDPVMACSVCSSTDIKKLNYSFMCAKTGYELTHNCVGVCRKAVRIRAQFINGKG